MSIILLDPAAEGVPDFLPTASVGARFEELGCEVKAVRKKTYTKIAEPHILASLESCDAVVTAIGD